MITAKQAREGTGVSLDSIVESMLTIIDERVKHAMQGGFFAIEFGVEHMDRHCYFAVNEKLKELGYESSIESGSQHDPCPIHLYIRWSKA